MTGFDLHSSNSGPRGMWGNEDTFWVVNDTSGSGTADKLYAYNRSDGSRDTANDFDNLNGAAGNNRPWGICSDGTTMFVGDRDDNKLYAYNMSDTTHDSGNDITLDSDNVEPRGMWCDATTVYVANDGATSANKVFAYTISGGAHDSTKDFEQLYVSTNTAAQNAETPRGIWSNGTTMFVADSDDDNVFAYKHSDESQDSTKNLALSGSNDNPNGMWFDGRILWVVDDTDDMIYAYDLPGAQPDNTPAAGDPRVRSPHVVLSVETPKDGVEVTADVSGITDSTDGVAGAHFDYQWIRVDGTDETDINGETGSTYTPTADDVDKHLKVRVVFDDDAGNREYPRTSPQFGPVVDAVPPTPLTATAATATTIYILFDEPLDPASTPAASAFAVQVGDTANTVVSAEIGVVSLGAGIAGIPGSLILSVSTTMLARETITVSYTKPDANPLQDLDRNEVDSFSDRPVLNTIRETFVSNLGQTTAAFSGNLAIGDVAQRFDTGSTASFDFTEVEVLFSTAPSSSATVTAVIADGLGLSNNIVATLTNPSTWSTNPKFGIPSGTTLSKDTTYYLIIEATDGVLAGTDSDAEDSGAAANWTIGNVLSVRAMVSDSGLGGTWVNMVRSISLQMAIRGKHHGNPGTPELAVTAKDQTLVLDVTVPDHGSSDLTGIEYRYKETTSGAYTGWTSVTGTISNSGGTFEIGGLNNGTGYTAQVQTVNDIGTSDPSTEESATPDAPPAVTSIAITSDAGTDETYAIGDTIEITLTFDKDLTLGGSNPNHPVDPYITFAADFSDDDPNVDSPEANCVIGTNTQTVECTRSVMVGEYDTDGIRVEAGSITYLIKRFYGPLGQLAPGTHPSLAIDSNHKIDGVRPTLTGAQASADKTKITLTFSEAIGAVDRTKITFQSGTTTLTTTADSISGSEVEITLTTALTATDTNVTVALAADAVTDAVGNGNAVLAASPIVDETAPTLSMTSTPSNTEVQLTYNEPLDPDSIPGTSAFTVKVGGTSRTISTAAASGASGIVLTLSTAFRPGDTLTVSYTVPTLNPIQDIAGNDAAALTDEAVSNTLPATAPEAVASLTASNTSTFGEVDLQWSGGTWANGSAITKHEVHYGDHTLIWSATLTVKDLGSNFLGCDTLEDNKRCEPSELLTDHTFSYDSRNYQIDVIELNGGTLKIETNQTFNGISAAALADLTLHVGALSFPFADATHSSGTLTWTGTGLSWSEDDMVPLAIVSASWTAVPDSAPGGANETSHTLEGLDPGGEYTFEVRAVNDIGGGGDASDTLTLRAPAWGFTLRDSGGNDITELTEGGDPATATVTITNASQATFGADQTVMLEWGVFDLASRSPIQGANEATTITIPANGSSGSLEISAPQKTVDIYEGSATYPFTATHGGNQIGNSIDLTRLDDEAVPVASITQAPTTVNEGENIEIEVALSVPYVVSGAIRLTVTDGSGALSGTLPDRVVLAAVQKMDTITLTAADNSVQNDGAREVTVTLGLSPDIPYTLGTPSTVTVTVRDDDTPPLAPENLRAQAGNTEATLRWDPPAASTPDHGQPVLHYEYRVKVGTGSFGSWQTLPNSDGSTTSHVFTGLTNNTEYTYEVRAENVAGDGAEAQVMVTPVVGVAVSFGAATASITEGGSSAVTLTLAEAPAAGTTVTAPITATPGAGLDATEYAGVPASDTFNAGETSKSFTVTTVDNTDDEPHRVLTLGLGTLPEGYVPGTHHEFVLTLLDDDAPVVSATFDRASASVPEGAQVEVTVRLSQAPEREVALALTAARGANLEADEFSGVPAAVTFAAAATEAVFTVTFGDDAAVEGNETLTLGFQTPLPGRVTTGANPQLVLTVLDDDGPPQAPAGLAVITGHGYAELSWEPVVNDSPVLRYEVRWRETDGGTFNA